VGVLQVPAAGNSASWLDIVLMEKPLGEGARTAPEPVLA
jgi:hypothetical protein